MKAAFGILEDDLLGNHSNAQDRTIEMGFLKPGASEGARPASSGQGAAGELASVRLAASGWKTTSGDDQWAAGAAGRVAAGGRPAVQQLGGQGYRSDAQSQQTKPMMH